MKRNQETSRMFVEACARQKSFENKLCFQVQIT